MSKWLFSRRVRWQIKSSSPSSQQQSAPQQPQSSDNSTKVVDEMDELTSKLNMYFPNLRRSTNASRIRRDPFILATTTVRPREEILQQIHPVQPLEITYEIRDNQVVLVFQSWFSFHRARCSDGNLAADDKHKLRYLHSQNNTRGDRGGTAVSLIKKRVDVVISTKVFGVWKWTKHQLQRVRNDLESLPEVEKVFVRHEEKTQLLRVAVIPLLDRDSDLLSLADKLEGAQLVIDSNNNHNNNNNNNSNPNNNNNKPVIIRILKQMIHIKSLDASLSSFCTKCVERGHKNKECTSKRIQFDCDCQLPLAQLRRQFLPLLRGKMLVPSGCCFSTNHFVMVWPNVNEVKTATQSIMEHEEMAGFISKASTRIGKCLWKEVMVNEDHKTKSIQQIPSSSSSSQQKQQQQSEAKVEEKKSVPQSSFASSELKTNSKLTSMITTAPSSTSSSSSSSSSFSSLSVEQSEEKRRSSRLAGKRSSISENKQQQQPFSSSSASSSSKPTATKSSNQRRQQSSLDMIPVSVLHDAKRFKLAQRRRSSEDESDDDVDEETMGDFYDALDEWNMSGRRY